MNVLYAASLLTVMEQTIGPRFRRATGYDMTGHSGASGALATEILGHRLVGDVFISASPAMNAQLEGPANGDLVSWYVEFGAAPLVIGYSPASVFAGAFTNAPWYEVITEPDIRLGRTDPEIDPKGALTLRAISAAQARYDAPSLAALTATSENVYLEEELVRLVESAELDAGFFYTTETAPMGLSTVELGGHEFAASYTITVLNGATNPNEAIAFAAFFLGDEGRSLLEANGLVRIEPRIIGNTSLVPTPISAALSR